MKKQTHKPISVYCAEKRGKKTINVKLCDFGSEEELAAHIKKLRDEQREKNKHFKENNTKVILFRPKTEELNLIIPNKQEVMIDPNIKLKLDPGTGNSTVVFGSSK